MDEKFPPLLAEKRPKGRMQCQLGNLCRTDPIDFSLVFCELLRMNIIDCEVSMAKMVCVLVAAISVDAFAPRPGGTR